MPKLIPRLTETQVRNAQVKEKAYKLYDEGGLRLLVRPSGTKVWQFPYRFQEKANTYTLGRYGQDNDPRNLSLSEAREKANEVRVLIEQGINPNAQKKIDKTHSHQKQQTSFEAIAREWHSKGTWVDKYAQSIIKCLERDVFPFIGYRQIDDITSRDIILVLDRIVQEKKALDLAKRVCQRCEAVFDYAILKGLCDNNPATGRSKFVPPPQRQHRPHLKETQLPEFLKKLDKYPGRPYVRLGLELLVLTFVRPGELRLARWEEVDFKNALWNIPAARMKMKRPHVVPLSDRAIDILNELMQYTGTGELLFPSIRSPHKPLSDVTFLKALNILGYKDGKKITPHGFRHTASTVLNDHGFNRDHIERQLAHVEQSKIRGVYNHAEYLTQRREMMQWYSDHLQILKAKEEGDE